MPNGWQYLWTVTLSNFDDRWPLDSVTGKDIVNNLALTIFFINSQKVKSVTVSTIYHKHMSSSLPMVTLSRSSPLLVNFIWTVLLLSEESTRAKSITLAGAILSTSEVVCPALLSNDSSTSSRLNAGTVCSASRVKITPGSNRKKIN